MPWDLLTCIFMASESPCKRRTGDNPKVLHLYWVLSAPICPAFWFLKASCLQAHELQWVQMKEPAARVTQSILSLRPGCFFLLQRASGWHMSSSNAASCFPMGSRLCAYHRHKDLMLSLSVPMSCNVCVLVLWWLAFLWSQLPMPFGMNVWFLLWR